MLHNEIIYIETKKVPIELLHNETIYIEINNYPLNCCIMKEQFILKPRSTH